MADVPRRDRPADRRGTALTPHRDGQPLGRSLYANHQVVYSLLRYGEPVKTEASQPTVTVHLIDWRNPDANDFVLVKEVALKGRARIPTGSGAVR